MKPIFFSFKSINITWFMALAFLAIIVSYFLLKLLSKSDKNSDEKREILENMFFLSLVSAFIGARLFYVIFNIKTFINSPSAMIKLSHYNLSLLGGVLGALLALFISAKKYKVNFLEVLDKFSILFYISVAIGVWNFLFDRFLLKSSSPENIVIKVISMSILFVVATLIQISLGKKYKDKYISVILLALTMIIYYAIKLAPIF